MRMLLLIAMSISARAVADPVAAPPRSGVTFAANVEGGLIVDRPRGPRAGGDLALGGWWGPQLAVTGRAAVLVENLPGSTVVDTRVGPDFQRWFDDRIWASVGAGFALDRSVGSSMNGICLNGLYLDGRIGYAFGATTSRLGVALAFGLSGYGTCGGSNTSSPVGGTSVGLVVGYQHL